MCIRIHRGKEREGIMKGGRVHGGGTIYIYIYIYVYIYICFLNDLDMSFPILPKKNRETELGPLPTGFNWRPG